MGRGGSDPGTSAMVAFNEDHTKAVIVVSNVSRTERVTDLHNWVIGRLLDSPTDSNDAD